MIPRLRLKAVGENASLNVDGNKKDRVPIFLSDIQHLLLYSLVGNRSPYLPSRWCLLDKCNKVKNQILFLKNFYFITLIQYIFYNICSYLIQLSHTVVLVVEGLSLYHFMAYESSFPHIKSNLEHQLELVTPAAYGGSIVEELVAVPLTGTQSYKLIQRI